MQIYRPASTARFLLGAASARCTSGTSAVASASAALLYVLLVVLLIRIHDSSFLGVYHIVVELFKWMQPNFALTIWIIVTIIVPCYQPNRFKD